LNSPTRRSTEGLTSLASRSVASRIQSICNHHLWRSAALTGLVGWGRKQSRSTQITQIKSQITQKGIECASRGVERLSCAQRHTIIICAICALICVICVFLDYLLVCLLRHVRTKFAE
jgi:hypothetical protein